MIITRISGGLGNQMFQYAIAKAMAKRNNDTFKLDLSFYPRQSLRKYELDLFKIVENIAIKSECRTFRGNEGLIYKVFKKLNLTVPRPVSYVKEIQNTVFEEDVFDHNGDIYLDGFWQNEKYFKDIKAELTQEFSPINDISKEAQNYLEDIKNCNSVSLHVRRGDYISDQHTNNVHGVCGLDYYKRAIKHMVEHTNEPVFYIFSDDIVWCKKNFDFLDENVFVDATKSTIDDLELMKNCKHNIIANSSFSWWGAWLNNSDKQIVISPLHWVKNNPNNFKWVPDTWLQK